MRNISASLTEKQILDSIERIRRGEPSVKDVTRRLGWEYLKVGERLQVCRKCMGRKPGEPLVKLAVIEVVSVGRERLSALRRPYYGPEECRREGFPDLSPKEFINFFCRTHKGCVSSTPVTRIEFKYILPCSFGIAIKGRGCPQPAAWSSTFNGQHSGMYWCAEHATDLQEGLKAPGHDLVKIYQP